MRALTLAVLTLFVASPALAEDKKPAAKPAADTKAAAKPADTKPGEAKPGDAKPATPAAPKVDSAKALNAIGLSIARSLQPLGLNAKELDQVLAGIREGASGKPTKQKLDQEAQQNLSNFAQGRVPEVMKKALEKSDAYVKEQAKQKGAVTTASGAVIIPSKEGTGATPTATDTVKVNYVGTLQDGTEFDSSVKRGQPAEFGLGNVIKCWTESLQKMKVGGKAKVYCPPEIAYGERPPSPAIPPNAALIFDVELLDIVKAPPPPPPTPVAPAAPKK